MKTIPASLTMLMAVAALSASAADRKNVTRHVQPLPLATVMSGEIATPAEQDRFAFSGQAGARVFLDITTVLNGGRVQLIAPSGIPVVDTSATADVLPIYLTETGTHTWAISAWNDAVGQYAFRMLDTATAVTIAAGTVVNVQLGSGAESAVFQYQGQAGERITIENLSPEVSGQFIRLISPRNETVGGAWAPGSIGETILQATGTYLVIVEGASPEPAGASLQLRLNRVSSPAGTPTGFGIERSGDIAAGEVKTFTFTAPAGLPVLFDGMGFDFDNIVAELTFDGGQLFFINASSDWGPIVLQSSGTYTLNIKGGDPSATGNYRFKFENLLAAPALSLSGTPTQPQLAPGEMKIYAVAGQAGQRVIYDSLESELDNVGVRLWFPAPFANALFGSNSDYDYGLVTLPQAGTYYLMLWNDQATESDAAFRLADADATAAPLAFNTPVAGSNSPEKSFNLYRFDGTEGQRLFFRNLNSSSGFQYRLYDSRNEGRADTTSDMEVTLRYSGPHILAVMTDNQASRDYRFEVVNTTAQTTELTLNQTIRGEITGIAEEHRFTFEGTAGQRLLYDALDGDNDNIPVRVVDWNGNWILNQNSDSDSGLFTLQVNGRYTLIIGGVTSVLGDYAFRLIDVDHVPGADVALDTLIEGILEPGREVDILRFNGSAGQRLFFDGLGSNGSANWYLYNAANEYVGSANITGDLPIALPQDGLYTIVITGGGADPIPYSLRIVTPADSVQPLTLGATVSGSFTEPGETRRFTFNGTAGQRLFYDSLQDEIDNSHAQIFSPLGRTLIGAFSVDSDQGPITLEETGTHVLVLGGLTEFLGDYEFRLLDLGAARMLASSTAVTERLDPAQKGAFYRIAGSIGQTIRLENTGAPSLNANWRLLNPPLGQVAANNAAQPMEAIVTSAGVHYLIVDGFGNEPIDLSFRVTVEARSGTSTGLGVLYEGTLGEERIQTISSPTATLIYIDTLLPNAGVAIEIRSTDVLVASTSLNQDTGPYMLTAGGEYTLKLTGSGDYKFRLVDLAAAAQPIAMGEDIRKTLADPHQTDFFSFSGSVRQLVGYDALLPQAPDVDIHIFSASGVSHLNLGAGSDYLFLTLTESTPYYLAVRSFRNDPADYAFQLLDPAQSPTEVITFDTTVGGPLTTVPAASLDVTGSYVSGSLRARPDRDDWRQSQTIAGTRDDPTILFMDTSWGNLADVGLTEGPNGSDANWEAFSVQWDGTVTISTQGTRLYTRSDDGSRLWVDINRNGAFDDDEIAEINWGTGGGLTLGKGSLPLPTGTFPLRVQYEEGGGANQIELMADAGASLAPRESRVFRFTATEGQRLYFDSLDPLASGGAWWLGNALGGGLRSGSLHYDTELESMPGTGTYILVLYNNGDQPVSYGFRITTPETKAKGALAFGTIYSEQLSETDERHEYTFAGRAGQRLIYDALQNDYQPVNVVLRDPSGNIVHLNQNADYDSNPFTLIETGPYTLTLDDNSLTAGQNYKFRVLDVNAATTVVRYDEEIGSTLDPGLALQLYSISTLLDLNLYIDGLGTDNGGTFYLYNPDNVYHGGVNFVSDWEINPRHSDGFLMVASGGSPDRSVPFAFKVLPANHNPEFTTQGNRTANELTALELTVQNSDFERANDTIRYRLDPGAPEGMTVDPATGRISWRPAEDQGKASYVITLVATDDGLPPLSFSETININVNEVNEPPVLAPIVDATIDEQTALSFTATATDPDIPANTLAFSLGAGAPAGATIHPVTGAFAWTPTEAQGPQTIDITVIVTDTNPDAINEKNLSASRTFRVTVREVNIAPALAEIGRKTVKELSELVVQTAASDVDLPANNLTYSIVSGPTGVTVSAAGVIRWTPTEAQGPGTHTIVVEVNDNGSPALTAQRSFDVDVSEVNSAPALSAIGAKTIAEGTLLSFTAQATDSDVPANTLRFSLGAGAPAGAVIDPVTGAFSWTPSEQQGPGVFDVTVIVTDSGSADTANPSLSDSETIRVTVTEVNVAPVLAAIGNKTVDELTALAFTAAATDSDLPANTLTFSLGEGAPAGASINAATGAFSWTPTEEQGPGDFSITIIVKDSSSDAANPALSDSETFTVHVNEVNVKPALDPISDMTVDELTQIKFTARAVDSDLPANTLTWSLDPGAPGRATINPATGEFEWTPSENHGNDSNVITIRVTDNGTPALNDTKTFTVHVREINVAPVLAAIDDQTVRVGTELSLKAAATDVDLPANTLTFSLGAGAPTGMTIDAATGDIRWKAAIASAGTTLPVTVIVSDNQTPALTDTKQFNVIVPELQEVRIARIFIEQDRVHLEITGDVGLSYEVQRSTDLDNWSPLPAVRPQAMPFIVEDTAPVSGYAFYTVVVRE